MHSASFSTLSAQSTQGSDSGHPRVSTSMNMNGQYQLESRHSDISLNLTSTSPLCYLQIREARAAFRNSRNAKEEERKASPGLGKFMSPNTPGDEPTPELSNLKNAPEATNKEKTQVVLHSAQEVRSFTQYGATFG